MSTLINAANIPLNRQFTSVPDLSGALQSYFQLMVFSVLKKSVSGFQAVESATTINCRGVIMPLSPRQLMMKPEGQRTWIWNQLFCEPWVNLKPDDCVEYLGIQYRIMSVTDYNLYGYLEYHLVQDFIESGP